MRKQQVTILLVLVVLGVFELPFANAQIVGDNTQNATARPNVDWRRTRNGWDRILVVEPVPPPAWVAFAGLHPLVLASLQILVSLGALVGFASESELVRYFVRNEAATAPRGTALGYTLTADA